MKEKEVKAKIDIENAQTINRNLTDKTFITEKPEDMKVILWGKEFCNGAEWRDFWEAVKEKNEENKTLQQQLAEKEKEIEELKCYNNQYEVWRKLQNEQIEKLRTELETYRPTKLKGNGQCVCSVCGQINWTDFCSRYDGKIYCDECFSHIITRDDLLRHQVCEEIAQALNEYIDTHRWKFETPDGKPKIVYIPNFTIRDILRKVEKGE